MAASQEELEAVPGIGPIVATAIVSHFRNEGNQRIVANLGEAGVRLESDADTNQEDTPQVFEGMRFVVTGRIEGFTRAQAESFIKEGGGQVSGSVSGKTNFVVVGEDSGTKRDDAVRLGVEILSKEGLVELAGGASGDE